jgi:hypothetical protein
MKFFLYFFLKKSAAKATQWQNLTARSAEFPDLKVAIEETKGEADTIGADLFKLESENGSIRQRWERIDGQWKRARRPRAGHLGPKVGPKGPNI